MSDAREMPLGAGSTASLPSFRKPPIVEVVTAVAFRRLPLGVVPMGELVRDVFLEHFPKVEERPPHDPPIERFGVVADGPQFAFHAGPPPLPRLWLTNEGEDELIQLQADWFACNWRRVEPEAEYARWPSRRAAFVRWFQAFADHCESKGLGAPVPTQCEVTYLNQVSPGETWEKHGELHKVLNLISEPPGEMVEQVRGAWQWPIPSDGAPIGRLHLSAEPAYRRADDSPIFTVNLTARGAPATPDLDGMLAFFNEGRRRIVTTFADVTTAEIQEEWERYE